MVPCGKRATCLESSDPPPCTSGWTERCCLAEGRRALRAQPAPPGVCAQAANCGRARKVSGGKADSKLGGGDDSRQLLVHPQVTFHLPGALAVKSAGSSSGAGAMMFRASPTNVTDLGVSFEWGAEERPDQSPRTGKTTLATSAQGGTFATVPRIHLLRLLAAKRTVTIITTRYGTSDAHLSVHLQRTHASDIVEHLYPALNDVDRVRTRARDDGAGGTPVSSSDEGLLTSAGGVQESAACPTNGRQPPHDLLRHHHEGRSHPTSCRYARPCRPCRQSARSS